MKAGILTFYNAINYGGVLQAYALQEYLKKGDIEAKIINYESPSIKRANQINRQVKIHKGVKLRLLKTVFAKLDYATTKKRWKAKYLKFEKFRNAHLDLVSKGAVSKESITKLDLDAIFVGSDQVWNPLITRGLDDVYFCDFPTNAKKISYAASTGSLNTIKSDTTEFLKLVENFDAISTRELDLGEYIKQYTEKETIQVVDPTLLLNKDDYSKIAIKPNINHPYLLIYKLQVNENIYKLAEKIAKEKGLIIYEIGFKPWKSKKGINYLEIIGPEEFLGLFEAADYIITNSFHGTVFSIINQKSFLTVPHRSVGQRMIDLLESLDLADRLIYSSEHLTPKLINKIDYQCVNNKLETRKDVSKRFIQEALKS